MPSIDPAHAKLGEGHTDTSQVDKEALIAQFDNFNNLEASEWAQKILQRPYLGRRPVSVIISGAGLAGITTAILLSEKVDHLNLIVLDRNSKVGGVWATNEYPGVRCDVPSHSYQLTFDPKTDWKSAYAFGKDIQAYWQSRVEKHGLTDKFRLNHSINEARWDESTHQWHVRVEHDGKEEVLKSDFFISSSGSLQTAKFPAQPGFESFKGPKFHPVNWPQDLDLRGKRVALLGNGATGVQILPELIKQGVAHVDHYVKRGAWIGHTLFGVKAPGYVDYTQEEIDAIQSSEEYHKYRSSLDSKLLGKYEATLFGTPGYKQGVRELLALMYIRVGKNDELFEKVVPHFTPGPRRLLPAPGYLEALALPNVDYYKGDIGRFTENGIVFDGEERPVDVIISSTGYVRGNGYGATPNYEIIGSNRYTLRTHFSPLDSKKGYSLSYLGVSAPGFPNYFYTLSVNSYLYCGTPPTTVEQQASYIAKVIRKVQFEDIASIEPKEKPAESFSRRIWELSQASSITKGGIGGYFTEVDRNGDTRVRISWPGSISHAIAALRDPRWEDFNYEYLDPDDQFAYLGNGKTWIDDNPGDKTFYLAQTGSVKVRNLHEGWISLPRDGPPKIVPLGVDVRG